MEYKQIDKRSYKLHLIKTDKFKTITVRCIFKEKINKEEITIQDLMPYPYLVFEQGKHNSFYFSEEFLSSLEFSKNIMVRDRATLFNLLIGLNGFTVCSGIIDTELNGENIISKPLDSDCSMRIGILTRKNSVISRYGVSYLNVLKNHLSID